MSSLAILGLADMMLSGEFGVQSWIQKLLTLCLVEILADTKFSQQNMALRCTRD